MPKLSKFFTVAVEGATVDGRNIDRQWILDMAATFNPDNYGVRMNMEHIRGLSADGPFKAYGDVRAVKTEERDFTVGGKKKRLMTLQAQVEPTDELIAYNKKGQKIYTSVEITPDYFKTGKAGLVGLAVTDSPASFGTEMLQFCANQGDNNPLASRKQDPGNFFSEAIEATLEFEDETAPAAGKDEVKGFLKAATDFFSGLATGGQQSAPPAPAEPAKPAAGDDTRLTQLLTGIGKLTEGMEAMNSAFAAQIATVTAEIAAVKASIDTTDRNPGSRRQPTGGTGSKFTAADF